MSFQAEKGWTIVKQEAKDAELLVHITVPINVNARCECSGSYTKHSRKTVWYKDKPIGGKHTTIQAELYRLRCKGCGHTSTQEVPAIRLGTRLTERCAVFIETQGMTRPFRKVAREVGCADKLVSELAYRYGDREDLLPKASQLNKLDIT